jgi:hypothetical protein
VRNKTSETISRFCFSLLASLTVVSGYGQKLELDLKPGAGWVDTNMDLQPGDTVRFTVTGEVKYANARQSSGPEGLPRGFADLIRILPLNDSGRGAVLGKIGSSDAARPFLIGARRESSAPIAGRLFVAINEGSRDPATGSFHLVIERTAAPAVTKVDVKVTPFPQSRLDEIPRRVSDPDGAPGDRTNFIVIGSQDRVQQALKNAGWVTVDRTKQDTILRGALATFSKQAYVTIPMSELQLFGRAQDYGYAQADPLRVVASRHHFRIWKAPFELSGQTVWIGAGTHDIGFDRDQRNGKITHKIDPDVDLERDYIVDSLKQTGFVVKADYMTPANPITTARTAHGEDFHSDGRTAIIYLTPDTSNVASSFGDIFCSVLKQNNPGGGDWASCERYIDTPGKDSLKLSAIPNKYRVLIVPGILSSCVADSPAFLEGQELLKKAGIDVDLLQVPNDSSESNAKLIAQYLRDHKNGDNKKYILIGYSKGAPDIQVALAQEQGVAEQVAAFITVAGASGGSPIADLLPKAAERYMTNVPLKGCQGDLSTGFKSLKKEARQTFLASYPHPIVPTYSLIAKSDATNTSKALLETWKVLSTFGLAQDGQLLRDDAIVPEAKYLGAALADHFAVALPFDKSKDSAIRSGMDKSTYPRAALLEALVRFVAEDLK